MNRIDTASFISYRSCTYLSHGGGCGRSLLLWLLANNIEHAILECLLVLGQPVLLPGVVKNATVKVVPSQARLEEADAGPVVRLLLELERAAVLHELFKF